jgi:hypothetical protein
MGKIVVKNVQSQNSAVSFKLPSTDGSANQIMKTDGSANLGFKDANNSFPSADGSSKTYTLSNTDGSSGQELQTSGTSGATTFGSPPPSPLSTPDGNHQGFRFCDKYSPLTDTPANSFTLTVPSSYTTTPSDVMAFRIQFWGMRGAGGTGTNTEIAIKFKQQDGTTTSMYDTGGNRPGVNGFNQFWNVSNSASSPESLSSQSINLASSSRLGLNMNTGSIQNGYAGSTVLFNSNTNMWSGLGYMGTFDMFNALANPHMWIRSSAMNNNYSYNQNKGTSTYEQVWGTNAFAGSTNTSQVPFHNSTGHTMGFEIQNEGSGNPNWIDGCATLWCWFKDGVVS